MGVFLRVRVDREEQKNERRAIAGPREIEQATRFLILAAACRPQRQNHRERCQEQNCHEQG